ncbi:hypothetical protein OLQ22_04855 [Campylobacter jejuni]|nr:hypothetical protein [Campylobacter jejuni]
MLQPNDSILVVGEPSVLQGVYHNVKKDKGQFPSPFGSNIYCFLDMKTMTQETQEKLLSTCLSLHAKINNKKLFIEVFNPTLGQLYEKLKNLDIENMNIYFNYTQIKKEYLDSYLINNNIGVFVVDKSFFEKNKKNLYELKIPLLKIGENDFDKLNEATILSSGESEIEAQSNVVMDLSAQLDLGVKLYHYESTHSEESSFVLEYFQSLARLYNKKIEIIHTKDENPILAMTKKSDALQFISFNSRLTSTNLGKSFSMDLNRLYYKMDKNYQLFIPVE